MARRMKAAAMPDRVDQRGPLPNEHLASSVQYEHALLLDRLDLHQAHRRSGHGFADRLGIRRIIFLALDVSLHIAPRHQAHAVPEPLDRPSPMMRRGGGFHPDQAWRQLRGRMAIPGAAATDGERQAPPPHRHREPERPIWQGRRQSCQPHPLDGSSDVVALTAATSWHLDAGWEAIHSINSGSPRAHSEQAGYRRAADGHFKSD
jgi:hypothetical protein